MATPVVHESTDIGSQEDLNVVERYVVDSGHEPRLGKRATPVCSADCGTVTSPSTCVAPLKEGLNAPDTVCSVKFGVIFVPGECEVSFAGHKTEITCISQGRLSELAREVFDACINNPKVATGGCIDIENDGGRVCLRGQDASNCF